MQSSVITKKTDWFSIMQFGFSLLGGILLSILAFIVFTAAVMNLFGNPHDSSGYEGFFILTGGLLTCALLLCPSAGYALAQVFDFHLPSLPTRTAQKILPWIILVLPVDLIIGNWLSNLADFGWIFLPGFHILALGIPILWMIYLGTSHIPSSSPQRRWGLFSVGLTLSPLVIIVIEMLVIGVFILAAIIWLSSDAQLLNDLYQFTQEFNNGLLNPEEVYEKVLPYVSHPIVYLATMAFSSLMVPLIEEAIKPLGVWFLLRKKMSPAEGFIAGLLCGAGYGMFENVTLSYNTQDWLSTVVGRMGTSLIHMATTGFVGWGLICAWQHKKYLQLLAAYLLAVSVHGLWNGLAITFGFASLLENHAPIAIERVGLAAPSGLFVLAIAAFLFIVISNRQLRKQSAGLMEN